MAPWVLPAIAIGTSVVGAGMSYVSQQNQASALRAQSKYQAQLQRNQALMIQQQAEQQAAIIRQQAEMQNEMFLRQAELANQQSERQAQLIRREGEMEAATRRQRARQAALAELRQAETVMDQQRARRGAIESAYAASGVTLSGTPAQQLAEQREVDAYNIEQLTYEGAEARKQMYYEARQVKKASEIAAETQEYVGLVESTLLESQGIQSVAVGEMEASSALYQGAVGAYTKRMGADATLYGGKVQAAGMRSRATAGLISNLGQTATMASAMYAPTPTGPTTPPGPVPTGPSYFKAGNPVRPPPAPSPSMFRG